MFKGIIDNEVELNTTKGNKRTKETKIEEGASRGVATPQFVKI